jgi:putative oxidoreductase
VPSLSQTLAHLRDYALSLNRLVLGLLFATHGVAALFGVLGGAVPQGGSISPWLWPYGTAALIQLVGGSLVFFGLATRPAAVLSSGSMAYAYFTIHAKVALLPAQNGGDEAVMFCWAFLLIALFGPGPLSLDALIGRVRRSRTATAPALSVVHEPAAEPAAVPVSLSEAA